LAIRVLLADDHAVVRDGLRLLLEAQPDIVVVGDAATGRDAVRQAQALSPDVVLMDIAMSDLNGVEATRQIRARCPTTQVVILSMHSNEEYIRRALQAGALGYVLKESAGLEVVSAIRTTYAGQRYLGQKIADIDAQSLSDDALAHLSEREREVLQLIVEGQTSARIADILGLSPKTVETYRSRLMQKLGIHDVPGLVKFAIQHGLTSLD